MTAILDRVWYSTTDAATYADCHPRTIQAALQSGELRGSQRKQKGRWRIHRDDLDAWIRGDRA